MKKSTQVLAAFLTIIMLLCCGTYATEKTSFDSEPLCHMTYHDVCRAIQTEEFDAVMRSYLSDLNEEGFDIRDISLGTPYNYLVANNSKIVAEDTVWYYPIYYKNNEIIGILAYGKHENENLFSVGKAYAEYLNTLMSETEDSIQMLFYKDCLYALTLEECYDLMGEAKRDFTVLDGINRNELVKYRDSTSQVYSIGQNRSKLITELDVYLANSSELLMNGVRTVYNYELIGFPIIYQGSSPSCWAGASAAIINYEMGTSYTYSYIVSYAASNGWPAGYTSTIVNVLSNLLSSSFSPASYNYAITLSTLQSKILQDHPVILGLWEWDDTTSQYVYNAAAHVVTAIGYNTITNSNITAIKVMDTATGSTGWTSYTNTCLSVYYYNPTSYKWHDTIVIK